MLVLRTSRDQSSAGCIVGSKISPQSTIHDNWHDTYIWQDQAVGCLCVAFWAIQINIVEVSENWKDGSCPAASNLPLLLCILFFLNRGNTSFPLHEFSFASWPSGIADGLRRRLHVSAPLNPGAASRCAATEACGSEVHGRFLLLCLVHLLGREGVRAEERAPWPAAGWAWSRGGRPGTKTARRLRGTDVFAEGPLMYN
jgi:hypothetical protein